MHLTTIYFQILDILRIAEDICELVDLNGRETDKEQPKCLACGRVLNSCYMCSFINN